MATDQPMTLDDHVARVAEAAEAHSDALANPGRTVTVDQGSDSIPLALVTGKRLDDARHDAMTHIHGAGGLGEDYAAAQEALTGGGGQDDALRRAEQKAALDLQDARQRIREAHGQPGLRVAGDAVRG